MARPRGKPSQETIAQVQEAKAKALKLRRAGATYADIAKQLDLSSPAHAYEYVKETLLEMVKEPAQEVLQLELERLDAMLLHLQPKIATGDTKAISTALTIMERRARYLGLDAPAKQETTIRDWRLQAIEDIKAGTLTYSALAQLFDSDLASELFQQAGVPIES